MHSDTNVKRSEQKFLVKNVKQRPYSAIMPNVSIFINSFPGFP